MPSLPIDGGTKDKAQGFLLVTACVLSGYFVLAKIVLPSAKILLPFLAALAASWAAQPLIRFFHRRLYLPRSVASFVALSSLVVGTGAAVYCGLSKAVAEAVALSAQLPQLLGQWAVIPQSLPVWVWEVARLAVSNLEGAIGKGISVLAMTAMGLPDLLFSIGTFLIATFLISAGFDRMSKALSAALPPKGMEFVRMLKHCSAEGFLKYLKGLALLLCINFALLWAGFLWMGLPYAFILALFTAAFDALPFIGTGGILIPWAVFEIALGNIENGTMLLIIFGVCAIVRQLAEPKVMGNALGLPPVASLMAVYAGYKIGGVWGMILTPVGLQVCAQLYLTFKDFKGRNYHVL